MEEPVAPEEYTFLQNLMSHSFQSARIQTSSVEKSSHWIGRGLAPSTNEVKETGSQ